MRILIVDDDMHVLDTLGKLFTTMLRGFQVYKATTANEGMSMIKQHQPQVIVVDVRLGKKSGMDLIEDYHDLVAQHKTGFDRPAFVVISAYDDEDARIKAEKYKVEAFLKKGFSDPEIIAAVLNAVLKVWDSNIRNLVGLRDMYVKMAEKARQVDQELGIKEKPGITQKAKVLVVDDEEDIMSLLQDIFKGWGLGVCLASNGGSALDLMIREKPDVIFLDLRMPGLNGQDILSIMRQKNINIPTIIITGDDRESAHAGARELGAIGIIQKPFEVARLKGQLAEILPPVFGSGS